MLALGLFYIFVFMTIEKLHQLFLKYPQVCTDTRNIQPNCIFFAFKGPNFNGNKFASEAIKNGAAYAIVDEEKYMTGEAFVLVEDVLKTLQQLANFHRNYCKAKIIGLTGSNGKTTTKELIYAVLSKKYNAIATKGNLNNHIGVPLTLLTIKADTEFAIIEMGANHIKEIEFLCNIAEPDFGYITNFGKAHLEGFGGLEGVIKGKSELYGHLIANKKFIFLNADDPIQVEKLKNYSNKYGYSISDNKHYKITLLGSQPFVKLETEETVINTQLIGSYNFTNCGAAVLMGKYFNVPLEDIKNAIEAYVPKNNRSQIIDKKEYHIILDAYNANPNSMEAALEYFSNLPGNGKVVFLGDMFELGIDAKEEHQKIVDLASGMNFDKVYLVGQNFYKTHSKFTKFATFEDLSDFLKGNKLKKGNLLIKGSRGMALERILDYL
ncbi:UDP-N-acetylmuramoyl-tripeptide--D-alanyl-D-alanine ligase [uncultured Eudoraea sp.]|uniref:UDP-N-acetylmuramoyl-tripeptide--D-alanyl-D- alanine ligase n=1 Tax=uncultured Eudoraea sp. TaxID=1035614 RepID=UPI00261242C2|nr:UDP-N-acetylmuramoyl-tripeptide--D-alanyl-D-alanine ligase [uncultured Eudoraea sp.]